MAGFEGGRVGRLAQARYRLLLAALLAGAAADAAAQTTGATAASPAPANPTPTAPSASSGVKGLTVTATPPPVRSSIDRRSYDISKDLNATTGTVADMLRSVPALSVDLQGTVSIRGDSNVVIMVDGKPSSLFQGPGRAQALQSLPADEYERVEVMTNPSAAFSPEGTAGIVNLISKKTRKPGRSGTVRANADPTGRWNAGLSASQKTDKLTLTMSAGVRRDLYVDDTVETRDGFATPATPAFTSVATGRTPGWEYSGYGRGGLDYDPNPATRLSASIHYEAFESHGAPTTLTLGQDAAGELDQSLDRPGRFALDGGSGGAEASYKRTFGRDDHDLSLSLVVNRSSQDFDFAFTDLNTLPPLPTTFDNRRSRDALILTDFKADYERPLPHEAKLKTGYELKIEDDHESNIAFTGAPSPAGPFDPAQADAFHFDRWINALYATYEQPIGKKLTFQAGLRLEDSKIRIDDFASGIQARSGNFHAYPTLHLSYGLNPNQTLLASYGQRVQRPSPADFDPYRTIASPFVQNTGNPNLRDQRTDDFELAWEYKRRTDFVHAGLYYKINTDGVTNAVTNLGDDVFLYQRENLVSSRNSGAELEASGQINKQWSYSLYGTVLWSQFDASTLGLIAPRSLTSFRGHGVVTWQPDPKDTVQFYVWGAGRTLTAEGYLASWENVSVGYRHKFDDQLSFFTTLQDAFNIDRYGTVYSTPQLFDRSNLTPHVRVLYLGFTYSFGAGPKRDQAIDIDGPGGPSAP
jgi:outer membrane receptor protein involved in Fe transport